jgi:hypothetical protein
MTKQRRHFHSAVPLAISFILVFLSACGSDQQSIMPTASPIIPAVQLDLPRITSIEADKVEVPNYEIIEFTLGVDAKFSNPYDVREISINGVFTSPDGKQWNVPAFWDGEGAWKLRFTPSQVGIWMYSISPTDPNGTGEASSGEFSATPSDHHGWIIPGNSFDPDYSPHYLVYHDGTPFYGVGFDEALNILVDGFDAEDGVGLFDNMKEAGANYVVWWPMYAMSIVNSNYDNYAVGNMKLIDTIIKDAEKEGIILVFTVWDHPNLRDETHAWSDGKWKNNGFSKLGNINSFFVSDEAWAWQENLYRYMIARWGYSTSIGMWQTVSEINGTNAYSQTDPWHEKVNNYFVENDPYRHPTTASGSGEVDWATGHSIMDVPQLHLYDFDHGASGNSENNDVVGAADHIAQWTRIMLKNADKPNWIGEFGVPGNTYYPELYHNSIWAALVAGASMTPAEWNSGGAWGRMTPEMYADLNRLSTFVDNLPLAKWNPSALQVTVNDEQIRGWGIAGRGGGLVWIQDYSLEGASIDVVRSSMPTRSGIDVVLEGLREGIYEVTPYDTWQGVYLDSYEVGCKNPSCLINMPEFKSDVAFRLIAR